MAEPDRTWTDRLRSLLRKLRPIHVAPLLLVVVLAGWGYASPIGAAPDDDFHLTSTWCANMDRGDLCREGTVPGERRVPPAVLYAPCFSQDPEVSGACIFGYLDRPSEPTIRTQRGSFQNDYPPIYYAVMNLLASPDLQLSALAMRWLNIVLFAGIAVALFLLLPLRMRPSLVLGWIITTVPLGLFLIPSNNPSSWAIMGLGFAWLALYGFVESTGGRRVALGVLFAVTGLMACARADSAIYLVIAIGVVGILTFERTRRFLLSAILPAVLAVVAVGLFLASRQSAVASAGLASPGNASEGGLSGFGLLAYNLVSVPSLLAGAFGGWALGWIDTVMPAIVSYGGLAVFIAVVFLGIRGASWRKVIVLGLVGLVLWLLPVYVLGQSGNVVGENVQPRYLLPLMVVFAGLAVLTVARRPALSFGRLQLVFLWAALTLAQAFALHFNLRRYLTGIDVLSPNLDDGIEWWWTGFPLTPMVMWALVSVAFSALIAVLLLDFRAPKAQRPVEREVADRAAIR